MTARLLTIGTEITSGEIVNSNAAWISVRLEDLGVRVISHLSVRDQRDEILKALRDSAGAITVVTGGLGPTSDDITREMVAEHCGLPLEFDAKVWADLERLYEQRGLKLLEAHRQQCQFPKGSMRLANPVGTALGFMVEFNGFPIFVLPGPPREMEAVWMDGVESRVKEFVGEPEFHWERWTCLGLPESEVADKVEDALEETLIEVGYRATVPYVKVKLCVEQGNDSHLRAVSKVEEALKPWTIGRGDMDLANELFKLWPESTISVYDEVCGGYLAARLFEAQRNLRREIVNAPKLEITSVQNGAQSRSAASITVRRLDSDFSMEVRVGGRSVSEKKTWPYKWSLDSERGQRSAAEWTLWTAVRALRGPRSVARS